MNDETTLSDLLALNLHDFEDEVLGIVDKAVKEMSMEKVLKELEVTWAAMEFEHEKHNRTGLTMLKASEELIETLEDNQVSDNKLTTRCLTYMYAPISYLHLFLTGSTAKHANIEIHRPLLGGSVVLATQVVDRRPGDRDLVRSAAHLVALGVDLHRK